MRCSKWRSPAGSRGWRGRIARRGLDSRVKVEPSGHNRRQPQPSVAARVPPRQRALSIYWARRAPRKGVSFHKCVRWKWKCPTRPRRRPSPGAFQGRGVGARAWANAPRQGLVAACGANRGLCSYPGRHACRNETSPKRAGLCAQPQKPPRTRTRGCSGHAGQLGSGE